MALSKALQTFVAEMRALYEQPLADADRWDRARRPLATLLGDADFRARAEIWAHEDYAQDRYFNLMFYEDPDHGFVVNALLKQPGQDTIVHDHGHSWTLYALLEGHETITRYERDESGAEVVRKTGEFQIEPGDIDLVPPWLFHAEAAGDLRTVAIIVRSDNVGRFKQNQVDPRTGELMQDFGPTQVPYDGA